MNKDEIKKAYKLMPMIDKDICSRCCFKGCVVEMREKGIDPDELDEAIGDCGNYGYYKKLNDE